MNWFLWTLVGINAFLIWLIANGTAFLGETGPMWRWPRPAGAPEWETDVNGKWTLYCTWLATLIDIGIIIGLIIYANR